jgi:tetratricopeptide (TPR) repeat protein
VIAAPFILALLASPGPAGAAAFVKQAEQAFLARDYATAEKWYAAAINAGADSADLEYDFGTAAAQGGDMGQAVLHLERALKRSPWDADARENLSRIREKRVDKVVGQDLGDNPLQRLLHGLPAAGLSWGFAILWVLAFVLLAFRRARGLAIAGALIALGCGGLAWAAERADAIPFGVVTAKVAEVRAGPDPKLPTSFEIHEGLKVVLEDREDGYVRVRLANGLEGWIEAPLVEGI